jgi:hypothetical protein
LRPLTGYEEEYVEEHRHDSNTSRLCNQILARCMAPPGQEPGEALERVRALAVAERDRALVALRRMSLGTEVRTEATCPRCQTISEATFSLDDLPLDFNPLPEHIDCILSPGGRAMMRLPTAGDQEALLDASESTTARRLTRLLARLLVALDGQQGPFTEEFVHALDMSVRRDLESALERALPDLSLSMNVVCAECAHGFNAPFDTAAFFLPRLERAPNAF